MGPRGEVAVAKGAAVDAVGHPVAASVDRLAAEASVDPAVAVAEASAALEAAGAAAHRRSTQKKWKRGGR